ncbi:MULTISPECIES: hypothetical protein [Proteus]|uniref:hypothetical protein n=2 Tax=Morganellaceae TaxID=1903414 RepID=UPI001377C350|nr:MULTISPECIES: hypothetical protein [Proteus]MBJ2108379.1 hypothetical protein [Proteus terrae]MBJ2131174.1 hypothetical protein [Proteus terrae]NBM10726.1 hypothetical protein [Proteus sp. G2670]NBM31407.1 hypothetical protein [Proteus sp. G2664]NBM57227.1 hypothetical protein [Proteus sp. G2667]
MKKTIVILISMLLILPNLVSCDNSDLNKNKYSAPFGLEWGMSINKLKNEIGNDIEILNSQENCPFVKVRSESLPNGLNNKNETYTLMFLPENKIMNFNGLMGVDYYYFIKNKEIYDIDFKRMLNNLELKYGDPTRKKEDNKLFKYVYYFDLENKNIILAGHKTEYGYTIWMLQVFLPKENRNTIDQDIDKLNLECKKERNPL